MNKQQKYIRFTFVKVYLKYMFLSTLKYLLISTHLNYNILYQVYKYIFYPILTISKLRETYSGDHGSAMKIIFTL